MRQPTLRENPDVEVAVNEGFFPRHCITCNVWKGEGRPNRYSWFNSI